MRKALLNNQNRDPNITYRGESPSRLDNLTDAVFGIAVTLLIFNLSSPNSLDDLIIFTKTLPAFLMSIGFLIIIWQDHVRFSEIFSVRGPWFVFLNSLFIALIIFYVYPLRFLTLFLTQLIFSTNLPVDISPGQIPDLMIYYGFVAFALYFILFWFYALAIKKRAALNLNAYELLHARYQRLRMVIMCLVPVLSILLVWFLKDYSVVWASFLGGMMYALYTPAIVIWVKFHSKASEKLLVDNPSLTLEED